MTAFPDCPLCGVVGKHRSDGKTACCQNPECAVLTWDTRHATTGATP